MSIKKPSYDHYLITESEDVSLLIRLRDISLTVALWVIYLYFIRESFPFAIDLFHWIANGFDNISQYPNLKIMSTIQAYGQVAAVMTVIYLGWAMYNMLRFRGRQRRRARANVTPDDLANMYGFSVETVTAWQDAPSLVMHHDAEGHLTDVKVGK
jgi:poly-beta-1,6-N-acetyl-D-glucosamine biosynthesis protein PgaD